MSLEDISKNLEPRILRCGNGCIEGLIPIVFNNVPIATIFAGIMDFKDPDVADQIKQVLLNLINNASDACETKGKGDITLKAEKFQDFILLTIEDNGIGIPPENIDKIFEPFFSTKPDVKGMGLGLSISYGIIKAHGWNLEVESRECVGTKFIIKIPVRD